MELWNVELQLKMDQFDAFSCMHSWWLWCKHLDAVTAIVPSWLWWALPGLFFLAVVIFSSGRRRLPPGPRALPMVGSFLSVGACTAGESAHQKFARLAEMYGPFTFFRIGSTPIVLVSDAKLAKAVLMNLDNRLASRPYSSVMLYSGCKSRFHHNIPDLETSMLFSPSMLTSFARSREREIGRTVCHIYRRLKIGLPINLTSVVRSLVFNMFMTKVLGSKSLGSDKVNHLKEVARDLLGMINFESRLEDFFPLLRIFDVRGTSRKIRDMHEELLKTAKELVEETPTESDEERTLVHVLSSFEGDQRLNDGDIALALLDDIVPRSYTTVAAIDWTLAELLRHPHIMHKAKNEIDSVVGKSRLVQESDLAKLPYLHCIVQESLRLHPPLPLGVPHMSKEACRVEGYDIPANSVTFINFWAIGRNRQQWESPLQFNPDRCLDSVVLQPLSSSGERGCMAMDLVLAIIKTCVAAFVHGFDWEPFGMGLIDIDISESKGFISSRRQDLVFSAAARLTYDAYVRHMAV